MSCRLQAGSRSRSASLQHPAKDPQSRFAILRVLGPPLRSPPPQSSRHGEERSAPIVVPGLMIFPQGWSCSQSHRALAPRIRLRSGPHGQRRTAQVAGEAMPWSRPFLGQRQRHRSPIRERGLDWRIRIQGRKVNQLAAGSGLSIADLLCRVGVSLLFSV